VALRSRTAVCTSLPLYVFDIMALDGDDLRRLPLSMRNA
jgi:ATP-dependent DNA ligase